MFTAVYSPAFDPGHIDANYIGDSGGSHSVQRLAFQVTQGQTYTVVVHETNPGGAVGQSYELRLPGCQITPASALNQVPVALAHDVFVAPGLDLTANAAVDDGSYDPDGGTITVTQSPPGPYAVGRTAVLLTVVDERGATAQASATVTVANPDGTADTTSGTGVASSVIGAGERGLTGCGSSGGPAPVALLGLAALAVFRGRRRAGASR
jgi:MYXO-CTERM domain-containing protein